MSIHVTNLIIANNVIDLSNTTPEKVIHDLNPPANSDPRSSLDLEANVSWSMPEMYRPRPKMMQKPTIMPKSPIVPINKTLRAYLEHRRVSSYISDMVSPSEDVHLKSTYVNTFLKD